MGVYETIVRRRTIKRFENKRVLHVPKRNLKEILHKNTISK